MRDSYKPRKYKVFTRKNYQTIPQIDAVPRAWLDNLEAVAQVFPFRVNNYVIDELIDWSRVPDDPVFQLTFPHPGMLPEQDLADLRELMRSDAHALALKQAVTRIHQRLNPHPAGQLEKNVPKENGTTCKGLQHKYRQTVLFFPTQGQTCHAYCTYCFRWVQFVGMEDLRFASSRPQDLIDYLEAHPEVDDVLFTGGDPLFMRTRVLEKYIDPLIRRRPGHVSTIRFGTKSLAYWPHRFVHDPDADDLIRLFERIIAAGYHVSIMAHFSHHQEMDSPVMETAVQRIRSTGAQIRCQAPLIRHINDDPAVWRTLWQRQVAMGMVPYYMFIARDTGPRAWFEVPLSRAHEIFSQAYSGVSGLCRTVRGPSMSADPGKVVVDGISEINGEKVFALRFLQARDPEWVNRPFFARFDPEAAWLDDLIPVGPEERFFFQYA